MMVEGLSLSESGRELRERSTTVSLARRQGEAREGGTRQTRHQLELDLCNLMAISITTIPCSSDIEARCY